MKAALSRFLSLLLLCAASCNGGRFAFASAPYLHVQADAEFGAAAPGSHTIDVRIHLHDTGGIASACIVATGGQKKATGVSANGDTYVTFSGVRSYKGYTVACQAD